MKPLLAILSLCQIILSIIVVTMVFAQQTGQSRWCWVPANSNATFCDYSTFGSCMSANQGKEPGTCVQRQN